MPRTPKIKTTPRKNHLETFSKPFEVNSLRGCVGLDINYHEVHGNIFHEVADNKVDTGAPKNTDKEYKWNEILGRAVSSDVNRFKVWVFERLAKFANFLKRLDDKFNAPHDKA